MSRIVLKRIQIKKIIEKKRMWSWCWKLFWIWRWEWFCKYKKRKKSIKNQQILKTNKKFVSDNEFILQINSLFWIMNFHCILLTVTFNLKELMLFRVCLIIHYWLLLIVLEMNFYHCLQKGYSTIFFTNKVPYEPYESVVCLDSSPKSTAFLISLGLRASSTSFFTLT